MNKLIKEKSESDPHLTEQYDNYVEDPKGSSSPRNSEHRLGSGEEICIGFFWRFWNLILKTERSVVCREFLGDTGNGMKKKFFLTVIL